MRHGIGDGDAAALGREGWVFAMEAMLHAQLGGAAPPAPDAELRNYLLRNLRLRGVDLSAALR